MLVSIYKKMLLGENLEILKYSILYYLTFFISLIIIFFVFRILKTFTVVFIFGLIIFINKVIFKKKNYKIIEMIFPFPRIIKNFFINKKIKEYFFTEKNIKFLNDIEKLINIQNKINELNKKWKVYENVPDRELNEHAKVIKEMLDEYKIKKVELKDYIINYYDNKIFLINIKEPYFISKIINDIDTEIIKNHVYLYSDFYDKYLKECINKLFYTKKEKLNNYLDLIILKQ